MKNGKASILVIAAGCLWGLIGLFTRRMTAAGLDAIQITVLRSLVTAVGLGALLLWKDRGKCRIVGKDIWMFMGTGICSIAAFNTLYFITMEQTTLSLAVVLLYTAPFFVLLLSAVCFGEKLTRQKWKGLLLALIGCICTTGLLHGGLHATAVGLLAGIGSGFCYALYSIFGKFALRKYSSETVTLYTFLVAALALLPLCHPVQMGQAVFLHAELSVQILLLGVGVTLLPFLLYTKGLSQIDPGKASVLAFSEPLTATMMGMIAFGEIPDFFGWMGIGLLFAALIVVQMPEKRKNKQSIK
ncbi:MAG TPA: DMT family transporter [Candidatus Anaerotignum merdipullorum]|nr:DMT family transporter [Candidatus Anaerotignum merdipullorum]